MATIQSFLLKLQILLFLGLLNTQQYPVIDYGAQVSHMETAIPFSYMTNNHSIYGPKSHDPYLQFRFDIIYHVSLTYNRALLSFIMFFRTCSQAFKIINQVFPICNGALRSQIMFFLDRVELWDQIIYYWFLTCSRAFISFIMVSLPTVKLWDPKSCFSYLQSSSKIPNHVPDDLPGLGSSYICFSYLQWGFKILNNVFLTCSRALRSLIWITAFIIYVAPFPGDLHCVRLYL